MRKFSMFLMVCSFLMIIGVMGLISRAANMPSSPKSDANINFSFDGLEAICFGNPEKVSLGFLNVAHHTPQLKVVKVESDNKVTMVELKGNQLHDTLYVNVEGRKGGDIMRYHNLSMDDPNDFRWTIDMESDIFQKQLYIKEDKLFGKIHFGSGLFYATDLSEERVRFIATDNSSQMLPFNRRIARPAMAINLQSKESLTIKGKNIDLKLKAESGVTYEIEITNIPPADMANMNHFLFYFDVLAEKTRPYEPVVVAKAAFFPRPIACNAVIFSQSKLN